MLLDKICIINAFKVNVIIQISASPPPHMNLTKPLKMSWVRAFKIFLRMVLHLF